MYWGWWYRGGRCLECMGRPVTFISSYCTYSVVLSSQMLVSCISPVSLGFLTTIMSPLSIGCSLWCAAIRYTSYLLRYSGPDREILHCNLPLCFRIAVYNYRRLALDGHSRTRRISPGGALTLVHPVMSTKSSFRWSFTASFH